ncbi:MAG: DUF4276 family protein [Spirochaetaceae bacterium]|jgi:hypothetical protein|nr:DUF4276 family protein [Spirochaetaceae bacterium]
MMYFTSVYEDEITHQVMLRIYGLFTEYICEHKTIHCRGNGKIKKQIHAYNNAAQYEYYFVITDLDNYECASSLITDWLPYQRSGQLLFRVAVHEVESWLLADRENFAAFFSISKDIIPAEPDNEPDPKQTVISLAKRSRKREIREDIVPIDAYASIGPGYNTQFQKFIQQFWDITTARKHSPSLDRAIKSFEGIIR